VPLDCAYELGDKLGVSPVVVEGAGHFNEATGYLEFGRLFEDVERVFG